MIVTEVLPHGPRRRRRHAGAVGKEGLAMIVDNQTLAAIEAVWEPDDGAMWKLRQGDVDAHGIEALLRILERMEVAENDMLPRRLVSFVWYLPIFFEWQRERVAERGADMKAFQVLSNRVVAAVQRVLGVP